MYILHIETSTKICSVALSDGEELVGTIDIIQSMQHTALLAPSIRQLMESHGVGLKELSAISVSSGPGSYTGLRVGSSTAKAMAYTLEIPVIAVPTLLSLAQEAFHRHAGANLAMPMIDARRNEVYTALYDRDLNEILSPFSLILKDDITAEYRKDGKVMVYCGDGSSKLEIADEESGIIKDPSIQCRAAYLVRPAYRFFLERQFSNPMHFVPFYLKAPHITQPRG